MSNGADVTIVSFAHLGERIEGDLTLPRGVRRPPIVVMLHGFTGTRNEWTSPGVPEGLFGRAAMRWASMGIASLRIDFRGSGESDGRFEDMTVGGEISDALAALDYAAAREDVDGTRLALVGMSLGGVVATATAARTRHDLSAVALWNPGINPPAAFLSMFGPEQIRAALESTEGPLKLTMPTKSVILKGAFFHSLFEFVPAAELAQYSGPVFLGVGAKDAIVYPQPTSARAMLRYHRGAQRLWVEDVDHGFDLDHDAGAAERLIDQTGRFFAEYFAQDIAFHRLNA